jgi:hypothetical protein
MRLPLITAAACLGLFACASQPPKDPAPREEGAHAQNPWTRRYPFAPTSLRIHPLTHVDIGPKQSQVVLHFELLDRYGDSVKGLGKLSIELYKPGAGMTPGIETQELSWDVPGMDDPDQNTRRFDLATRTYRVPLSAPPWVQDAISPEHGPGWVKVRAVLTVDGEGGEPRYLEDEYVIQG